MRSLLSVGASLLLPATLIAQDFTITDGANATYNQRFAGTTAGGVSSCNIGGGCDSDNTWQATWCYSVTGTNVGKPFDDMEPHGAYIQTPLPPNGFVQDFLNTDGLGLFDANWLDTIAETGGGSGSTLTSMMTVTNTSASQLDIKLYYFADVDVHTSFGNDYTGPGSNPTRFVVLDNETPCGGCIEVSAPGATHYQVDTFGSATGPNDNINAGNDLPDTGLPFGSPSSPLDFTGAFQFDFSLAPGASGSATIEFKVNMSGVAGSNAVVGAGVGGLIPTVTSTTVPRVGRELVLDVTGGTGPVALLFAISPAPTQIPGFGIMADPVVATAQVAMAGGVGSLTLPVGCSSGLFGLPLATQGLEIDATSPVSIGGIGYSASAILVSTVGD